MKRKEIYTFTLVLLFLFGGIVKPVYGQTPNSWKECSFSSADELIKMYQQKTADSLSNDCYMIMCSGKYVLNTAGKSNDLSQLLEYIPTINLNSPQVFEFVQQQNGALFADSYFMLHALKGGATFDEARDGVSITTQFPIRSLNKYDFYKLEQIFSSSNIHLQNIYLDKMKFMFDFHGCTPKMINLKSTIEKNCYESNLKNEILNLYKQYKLVTIGEKAPNSTFYTLENEPVSISSYKGKLVIIDVWATWCSSCIKKMPEYMELKDKYKNNKDIIFLAVSIDQEEKTDLWKKTIENKDMHSLTNLIAPGNKSSFSSDYFITGVPRYIIISKESEIINAYTSLDNIEQIIETTIRKTL